ncbi:hypothetical protein [Paraburkholderia oxyphila]|uniref:hypothetical protein n=1 Tax=Paraburkholderia oxyphila TaxID=614212 RepID=UPI000489AE9B|nr:hypothetical protein [Paraburkholderia oxyphila]
MALNDLESGEKANAYRVRKHLEEIEAAIERRVPIKAIHAEMCASNGLTLTLEAFKTTLKRARGAKRKETTQANPAPQDDGVTSQSPIDTDVVTSQQAEETPVKVARNRKDLKAQRAKSAADFEKTDDS